MKKIEYKPIPVEAAKEISDKYEKSIVLIWSWDPVHELLHTTTYGKSIQEKNWAARGGEIAAEALGAIMTEKDTYEDFRPGINKKKSDYERIRQQSRKKKWRI